MDASESVHPVRAIAVAAISPRAMTFFIDEALPGRGWWVRRKSADASDLQVNYRCVGAHAAVVAMVSHAGIESQ
ncbi:hypothetical protein Misp05_42320 [Micromonospora sp. NBRC 107095]|nr:hypothetical protein Misp05_42320 [Micromonospora sp. NBRC 107095]